MPPHYSGHARSQMRTRSISETEVEEALASLSRTSYTSDEDDTRIVVLAETEAGRRLKVVISDADPPVIVTVADRDK